MSISLRSRIRQGLLLGCVSGAALLVLALGQASAATYPNGGSTFTGSAEGWTAKAECPTVPVTLLCSAEAGFNGGIGHPPGGFADKTTITVNLLGAFHSEAVEISPTFTTVGGGSGSLNLERQFENAELLSLAPSVEYTAYLVDKTTNTKQKAITEAVEGASPFTAKSGAVALVAGHSYAVEIDATTKSTTAAIGLLGSATFSVDNVSVTGPDAAGPGSNAGANGGNGGNGGNAGNVDEGSERVRGSGHGSGRVSSARLESLIRSSSLVGAAMLKGNRLFVKARCPAKVGATCTLSLRGLLNRHKAATATRRARIKKGKTKRFVVKVKPAARKKVKSRKRLLFKETVRVGRKKATVYKSLKLVRK